MKTELYPWETQEKVILIEKGIVGIFNKDFEYYKEYIDDLVETVEQDYQAGVLKGGAVCNTAFGNDSSLYFDAVNQNNKIVAIKISFNIDEND